MEDDFYTQIKLIFCLINRARYATMNTREGVVGADLGAQKGWNVAIQSCKTR